MLWCSGWHHLMSRDSRNRSGRSGGRGEFQGLINLHYRGINLTLVVVHLFDLCSEGIHLSSTISLSSNLRVVSFSCNSYSSSAISAANVGVLRTGSSKNELNQCQTLKACLCTLQFTNMYKILYKV